MSGPYAKLRGVEVLCFRTLFAELACRLAQQDGACEKCQQAGSASAANGQIESFAVFAVRIGRVGRITLLWSLADSFFTIKRSASCVFRGREMLCFGSAKLTGAFMKPIGKMLIVVLALLSSGFLRAATQKTQETREENAIANTLMKQIVDLTTQSLREWDPEQSRFIGGQNPENSRILDTCYLLAFLYKTPSALNPYYGKPSARDQAIAIADLIVATDKDGAEWPLYWLDETYVLLRPEIPAETAKSWKAFVANYVATRGQRPFFYTAPNHNAWNAMAIYRAGQVFGEEQWMDLGSGLMHELIKTQTSIGYFDEGPGNGPSMKFNNIQLTAMMLYYKFSNDPVAFAASNKLATFMIRYSYPDGSPIAAFDARQDYWIG
ncbi:MAG: hypothetical protein ABI164_01980, partial [Acidobacteriaceae bacterium]